MCTITMISSGTIYPYRYVVQSASNVVITDPPSGMVTTDETVHMAYDSFVPILGVSDNSTYTALSKVDVTIEEIYHVQYGDTVTAGQYLTTDSVGRAIPCTKPGQRFYGKAIFGGTVDSINRVAKIEGIYVIDKYNYVDSAGVQLGTLLGYDYLACGAGLPAIGVVTYAFPANSLTGVIPVYYATSGVQYALTGGSYSAGDSLVSDSYGRVVKATNFSVASSAVTYDSSKLTTTAGSTPVTAGSATGAVMSAASGFVALATPVLTGSALPQTIIGYAIEASGGASLLKKIKLK